MNEPMHRTPGDTTVAVPAGMPTAAADLLLARAKDLAREKATVAEEDSGSIEVLVFGLASETYAFALTAVREVATLLDLTPLPGVPEFVLGITSLRGQIVAVIDLRKLFNLPERGLHDSRQVMVLQSATMEFGVLAERVAGVKRLSLATLQRSLPTLTDVRAAYLEGIAPDGTVVLSAAKLLADAKLVVKQGQ